MQEILAEGPRLRLRRADKRDLDYILKLEYEPENVKHPPSSRYHATNKGVSFQVALGGQFSGSVGKDKGVLIVKNRFTISTSRAKLFLYMQWYKVCLHFYSPC